MMENHICVAGNGFLYGFKLVEAEGAGPADREMSCQRGLFAQRQFFFHALGHEYGRFFT